MVQVRILIEEVVFNWSCGIQPGSGIPPIRDVFRMLAISIIIFHYKMIENMNFDIFYLKTIVRSTM